MKEKSAYEKLKEANICPVCNGSRKYHYKATDFEDEYDADCPQCNGTGYLIDPELINSFVEEREREAFEAGQELQMYLSNNDAPEPDWYENDAIEDFPVWQSHNRKRL